MYVCLIICILYIISCIIQYTSPIYHSVHHPFHHTTYTTSCTIPYTIHHLTHTILYTPYIILHSTGSSLSLSLACIVGGIDFVEQSIALGKMYVLIHKYTKHYPYTCAYIQQIHILIHAILIFISIHIISQASPHHHGHPRSPGGPFAEHQGVLTAVCEIPGTRWGR